jgi:hypothetical protein
MVMTIAPQAGGNTSGVNKQAAADLVPFTIGAAAGGVATFALASVVGGLLLDLGGHGHIFGLAVAGSFAIAYGLSYVIGRPLPLPRTYRQVPKLWREVFSARTAGLLYGVGLGLGFFTKVPYATFYIAIVLSGVVGDPLLGIASGATFGLARALPPVVLRLLTVRSEDIDETLETWSARLRLQAINGVLLGGTGLILLAGAAGA